jgi:hypothetical protein
MDSIRVHQILRTVNSLGVALGALILLPAAGRLGFVR